MIHLRILGNLDLSAPDEIEIQAVRTQPKRLALLVYLALAAPGGYVRRDTLLNLFWPDSDAERARGAFRQAVRFLRRNLGSDVITSRGSEEVGVNEEAFWLDAVAFSRAAADNDHAAALELYRGDLLEGFFVSDAPAFEEWLDAERTSLRRRAASAATALADADAEAGNLPEAIAWARRGLELAPFDESAARRLITLLDRNGNRAGAVAAYTQFAQTLERELDVTPSPETEALLDTLRARTGDGMSAHDVVAASPMDPSEIDLTLGDGSRPRTARAHAPQEIPAAQKNEDVAEPPPARPRRKLRLALIVGVAVLAVGSIALFRMGGVAEYFGIQPVMVVPFENLTGDPSLDALGIMAADWITEGIIRTRAFEVVPSTAMLLSRRYVDELEPDAGDHMRLLVQETGARSIISGSYFLQGDSLFFHTRVTRVRGGVVLAVTEHVGVGREEQIDGITRVRERVLASLAPLTDVPTHARAAMSPPSYEAYMAYVAGMEAFFQTDFPTAIRHYERSAAVDGTYPMPLLASAIAHMNLGNLTTADSIAHAVEGYRETLGPLEEITLDFLQAKLHSDHVAAYEAMLRHRRIAPATIGHYQVGEQARALNRPREALRTLNEFDPEQGELRGWFVYWRELVYAHHMLGQHRRELRVARRARVLYPDHPLIVRYEVRALAAIGRVSAIDELITEHLSSPQTDETWPGVLMMLAANDLATFGHPAAAEPLFERSLQWFASRSSEARETPESRTVLPEPAERFTYRPPDEQVTPAFRFAYARALFHAGRWDDAEVAYLALEEDFHDNLTVMGQLGVLAAALGDRTEAHRRDAILAETELRFIRWQIPYWRAAISTHLGEHEDAVELLHEAFRQGMPHGPWHPADPNLAPLRDYGPFQELLRPHG